MGCSCSSFRGNPIVHNPVRACTELELGKYKSMMTQEEQLAAEDATRASNVKIWVLALEEVPKEVLADALEQERAYRARVAERKAQQGENSMSRGGSR
eukprot:CAMPEP_0181337712 /NCGR_PEP_ID=MMETSP1101-20121128/28183_1 /TAXON_ID=46948 /ORGANISM="Rhodomonas abbreviata, Strain Caron Lab Isolate" /LENGTH=97 /DNA_ID=CAMNT_0023448261 /DNA_START=480 /DNA_END=769 /DNA_ORIENTATION=+